MKGFIYSNQIRMDNKKDVIGFGDENIYVKEIPKKTSNNMIIKNHYSKKVAGFATTYIYYGVFYNNELIGTLQYGFLMNPASCKNIIENSTLEQCLELNRAWYKDNLPSNIKSMALCYSFKIIKHNFKDVIFIQSFADERCGKLGITYQAANFQYYGKHESLFWFLGNKYYHNIHMTIRNQNNSTYTKESEYLQNNKDKAESMTFSQYRYIYWIKPKYRNQCLLKEQPYPKHYKD